MSDLYETRFGTDWKTIDGREEAVERAFALGVAARLGERHPGELDRINEAIDTTYDQSFVELAYHEGREKASDIAPQADEDEDIWTQLVEEETVIDPDDRPTATDQDDEDDSIPDAVRGYDVDTRPDDTTETVERPSMLDRTSKRSPADRGETDRTVFGRKREEVEPEGAGRDTTDEPESDAGDDGDGDADSDSESSDESDD